MKMDTGIVLDSERFTDESKVHLLLAKQPNALLASWRCFVAPKRSLLLTSGFDG
jgi:hypothetical protein